MSPGRDLHVWQTNATGSMDSGPCLHSARCIRIHLWAMPNWGQESAHPAEHVSCVAAFSESVSDDCARER